MRLINRSQLIAKAALFLGLLTNFISFVQAEEPQSKAEVFPLQTHTSNIVKIVTENLYAKDAVVRELISNASDAIKKYQFLSFQDKTIKTDAIPLEISVMGDEEKHTLIIQDSGIGMTKEQLISDLGTIARSGTKEFREREAKDNTDLIGNFGVGFYSAFLIASKVTVISKSASSTQGGGAPAKQYIWQSRNDETFSVAEDFDGEDLVHGTRIILELNSESLEFCKQSTLESLIVQYSQFIEFPIKLYKAKTVSEEVDLTPEEIEAAQAEMQKKKAEKKAKEAEKKAEEEGEKDANEQKDPNEEEDKEIDADEDSDSQVKTTKTVEKIVKEYVQVNHSKPIWQKAPSQVTDEEYREFYKAIYKKTSDPLMHGHFKVEGDINFTALVYVDPQSRFNPMDPNDLKNKRKISLYIRKVFINDSLTDLLPSYLGFVSGIVDSEDLKLNISREAIQNSKVVMKPLINHLTLKILGMFKDFASESAEKYLEFWKFYGTAIKYGVKEDSTHSKKLAELLRFQSSNEYTPATKEDEIKFTSLADYADRAEKKGQKKIFYCSGSSSLEILKLPHAEAALSHGVEILLFDEPFDQYVIKQLQEYRGMKFQDISEADVDFGLGEETEEQKAKFAELQSSFKPLSDWMLKLLDAEVDSVIISKKLAHSPLAVSSKAYGMSGYMMKVMNAQNGSKDNPYISFLNSMKKTVEINPKHQIIQALNEQLASGKTPSADLEAMAKILFDSALLASGYEIRDAKRTSSTIDFLIRKALGLEIQPSKEQPKEQEVQESEVQQDEIQEQEVQQDHSNHSDHSEHDEL